MSLAVTPLLVILGTVLLAHVNVRAMLDVESCLHIAGYGIGQQTYWTIATDAFLGPSGPVRIAFLAVAFLPFIIAAAFVRSARRLYCQWAGLGIVLAGVWLLFHLDTRYREPGWCLQPDMTDFGLQLLFSTYVVVLFIIIPIFTIATLIGLSLPAKDAA